MKALTPQQLANRMAALVKGCETINVLNVLLSVFRSVVTASRRADVLNVAVQMVDALRAQLVQYGDATFGVPEARKQNTTPEPLPTATKLDSAADAID